MLVRSFVFRASRDVKFVRSKTSAVQKIPKRFRSRGLVPQQGTSSRPTLLSLSKAKSYSRNQLGAGAACGFCRRCKQNRQPNGLFTCRPFPSHITASRLPYTDIARLRKYFRIKLGLKLARLRIWPCRHHTGEHCDIFSAQDQQHHHASSSRKNCDGDAEPRVITATDFDMLAGGFDHYHVRH